MGNFNSFSIITSESLTLQLSQISLLFLFISLPGTSRWYLFSRSLSSVVCNFIKKELCRRCFLVKFVKFIEQLVEWILFLSVFNLLQIKKFRIELNVIENYLVFSTTSIFDILRLSTLLLMFWMTMINYWLIIYLSVS